MSKNFILEKTCEKARAGVLKTRKGEIKTPFFMSVATSGAIKGGVSSQDLGKIQAPVVLCNTYHLHLRPGAEIVAKNGGLHNFMKWEKPILTDSGGFQVFSIKNKKVTDDGVWFRSHIDGQKFFLDAEKSIDIQHKLGADIIMVFDECPPNKLPNPANISAEKLERKLYFKVKKAVERTTNWAKRSLDFHHKKFSRKLSSTKRPQIFGIIQGGTFADLREKSLGEITDLDFDGYALGGLAVGEKSSEMYKILEKTCPKMPIEKPRYLMGVGTPSNLLKAISLGIDMFDCVLPSRNARHGTVYTENGEIKISNSQFKEDLQILDENCGCPICSQKFSRSFLHHLIKVNEDLGKRYLTIHNLYFYHDLMRKSREHILIGDFENWKNKLLEKWNMSKNLTLKVNRK